MTQTLSDMIDNGPRLSIVADGTYTLRVVEGKLISQDDGAQNLLIECDIPDEAEAFPIVIWLPLPSDDDSTGVKAEKLGAVRKFLAGFSLDSTAVNPDDEGKLPEVVGAEATVVLGSYVSKKDNEPKNTIRSYVG